MAFEIYLSPPHTCGKETLYLQRAMESNSISAIGPDLEAFEREVSAYLGHSQHAVAVCSGTAAIHLALLVSGVVPGDLVLCSDFTFVASAAPILYCGAEPVFVDCDPSTWNFSVTALRKALQSRPLGGRTIRAAVVANLYGQSADYEPILELCRENGVAVIEDAAESFGATYRDRRSGTLGDLSVLSFNGNKIITSAAGGMVLSAESEPIERARYLARHAREAGVLYQHGAVGFNYQMSNLLAAVGRAQLPSLDERVQLRRAVFQRYRDHLAAIPGVSFMPEADYGRATRWLTVMTLDPRRTGVTPLELCRHLETFGIESRPVWKPMHTQPSMQKFVHFAHSESRSESDFLFSCGICLPSGSNLSQGQQGLIISEILRRLR